MVRTPVLPGSATNGDQIVPETRQPSINVSRTSAEAANEGLMAYLQSILVDCQTDMGQLRQKLSYTYWVIIAMCITMFILGFAFLSLPLWRKEPIANQAWLSLVLPVGVGIGNLLALYLYKPLERIQKLMADIGQVTITFNSFQTQVALLLIGTDITHRETMGEAAMAVNTTSEVVLRQIHEYFEQTEQAGVREQKL